MLAKYNQLISNEALNESIVRYLNKMKTVSFNVKLPDNYYKCSLTKSHKCIIIKPIEYSEPRITRSITPNQLVYTIKEFNLLTTFRQQIFDVLKHLNTTVLFIVVEPQNGRLIDYAW